MNIYSVIQIICSGDRVIDVGSEWRTFSNEKALKDPSRVGDAQNPLLNGGDLTTMISKVRLFEIKSQPFVLTLLKMAARVAFLLVCARIALAQLDTVFKVFLRLNNCTW